MRTHDDCGSNNYCFHLKVVQSAKKKADTNCSASIVVDIESFRLGVASGTKKTELKNHYSDPYSHLLLPEFNIEYLLLWCQPRFRGHSWWINLVRCQSPFAYQWSPVLVSECKSPSLLKFVPGHLTVLVIVGSQMEMSPFCRVKTICWLVFACGSWYCCSTFQSNLQVLSCPQSIDIVPNYSSTTHLEANYFPNSTVRSISAAL